MRFVRSVSVSGLVGLFVGPILAGWGTADPMTGNAAVLAVAGVTWWTIYGRHHLVRPAEPLTWAGRDEAGVVDDEGAPNAPASTARPPRQQPEPPLSAP